MILAESPRWNQDTKQETVVEGYPDLRKTDALGRVYVVHANSSEFSSLEDTTQRSKRPHFFH